MCERHEDWVEPGAGGWWLLVCPQGHSWRALLLVRSAVTPGGFEPAECPVCGEKGVGYE